MEILDEEDMQKVIVVGHDLGSKIASRMANFYPERCLAYAFLAVPYSAPRPMSQIDHTLRVTKKMCGYELCGHVYFCAEDEANRLIEDHLDSFFSAIFPTDPKIWVTQFAPVGALKSWLERDVKFQWRRMFNPMTLRHGAMRSPREAYQHCAGIRRWCQDSMQTTTSQSLWRNTQ
ncbi:hypothetical protein BJ912DRAFT_341661 [Pholiota molesta]|nr:hypothetical protein BJ912DRAFT_341661 [Pholiota molesta]